MKQDNVYDLIPHIKAGAQLDALEAELFKKWGVKLRPEVQGTGQAVILSFPIPLSKTK